MADLLQEIEAQIAGAKTAAAKQNPRQKPLVITIAADAKYYIRNEARLISQGLMRRSTMQTINISEV